MIPYIIIGGLEISTWRLFVLTSVVICWIFFLIRSKNLGYSFYTIFPWLLFGLPVGTLGGHLFNKLIPSVVGLSGAAYSFAGLTIIGSIIACVLYSFLYIKYVIKSPPTQLLDAVAFTFPLSILIGRLGCFLSGSCYGRPSAEWINNSFLSVFTLPVNFYVPPSTAWHAYRDMPPESLVWNLPLLLILNASFGLVVTETIYRNRAKWSLYPGTVFAAAGALDSGGRFFIEFFRKEEVVASTIFNPWQLAILVIFCIFFLWLCFSLYRRRPQYLLNL